VYGVAFDIPRGVAGYACQGAVVAAQFVDIVTVFIQSDIAVIGEFRLHEAAVFDLIHGAEPIVEDIQSVLERDHVEGPDA